ncbi:MAG: AFG1 family ATPase [Zoogloeaceae bacterium]|nr:AFG1 family ATPase [Zoogloeaceae bacterium]
MPHGKPKVPREGVAEAYARTLAEKGYAADAAQMAAARCLQRLYEELLAFKVKRGSALKRWLNPPRPPRGVYFWGGVGRGKSFLMDCFFKTVPYRRKIRVHFHAFMRRIHAELDACRGEADPMRKVAEKIAGEARLLCFDEFHVSDIADAMILGRLLAGLEAQGVILVMTSNYPPDGLYPNGLHRESFLPAIERIKRQMDVIEVDAGIDYRLRVLTQAEIYHHPADAAAEERMRAWFDRMAPEREADERGDIEILGRAIPARRRNRDVIWFDFEHLCGGPRSQNDYLEIAHAYSTVLLSNIPRMGAGQSAEARRFTWLVDVFYDHRIKLMMTAACAAESLYTEGVNSGEFFRTVSRLVEMRSREYLTMPVLRTTASADGNARG